MKLKKNGVILYAPEDIDKNRFFIETCKTALKEYGIRLKEVIVHPASEESCEFNPEDEAFPDFAINRSRNADIAMRLERAGVRVFNSAKVTRICNDKWLTYLYLKDAGLPAQRTEPGTGATLISNSDIQYPRVLKSRFGHGGNEVFAVFNEDEERKALRLLSREYIVQPFVGTGGRDVRAYITGGRVAVAMTRTAKTGFRSNYSLGASARPYTLSTKEESTVLRTANGLRMDYAAVDFFYDGDRMIINELEDAAGARMVYENTDIDLIREFARYVAENI